jgi:hypothetical protein
MKIYRSHASDNNLGFVCLPHHHPHESNIEDMWPHPALILACTGLHPVSPSLAKLMPLHPQKCNYNFIFLSPFILSPCGGYGRSSARSVLILRQLVL